MRTETSRTDETEREGDTVQLAETAHLAIPGRDIPTIDRDGELKTNAWMVFEYCHNKAILEGAPELTITGIAGYRWIGAVNQVLREIFGEKPEPEFVTWRNNINSYLKRSHNMVCLQRKTPKSVWWIRAKWNDAVPERSPRERTKAASEPTVTYRCTEPGCKHPPFKHERGRIAHIFRAHRKPEEWVVPAVTGTEFLTLREIHRRARAQGLPLVDEEATRLALRRIPGVEIRKPNPGRAHLFRLLPEGTQAPLAHPDMTQQTNEAVEGVEDVIAVFEHAYKKLIDYARTLRADSETLQRIRAQLGGRD